MKKSIISRMKSKKAKLAAGVLAVILGMFPWSGQSANAATYTINTGAPSATNFNTLNALRGTAITWANDTIQIINPTTPGSGVDNTLGTAFVFDGATVNINRGTGGPAWVYVQPGGAGSFINEGVTPPTATTSITIGANLQLQNFTTIAVNLSGTGGSAAKNLTISGTRFDNNTGGGIAIGRGTLTIQSDARFTRNTSGGGYGGAVDALRSDVSITGSRFGDGDNYYGTTASGNKANSGGALSIRGFLNNSSSATSPHTLTNTYFGGNNADGGGALAAYGGAVYLSGAYLKVDGSNFITNSVTNLDNATTVKGGGAIYSVRGASYGANNTAGTNNPVLDISGTLFRRNSVSQYGAGGAILAYNNSSITLDNDSFYVNTVANTIAANPLTDVGSMVRGGGGALAVISDSYTTTTTITGSRFGQDQSGDNAGNTAGKGGAILIARFGTESTLSGAPGRSTLNVDGSQINYNMATATAATVDIGGGGGIWARNANVNINKTSTDTQMLFRGNTTGNAATPTAFVGDGGAIAAYNAKIDIGANTLFDTNMAQRGGAIALDGLGDTGNAHSELVLTGTAASNVVFQGNVAATLATYDISTAPPTLIPSGLSDGGAIYVNHSNATISYTRFGNNATIDPPFWTSANKAERGGALFLGKTSYSDSYNDTNRYSHNVTNTSFYRNLADIGMTGAPAGGAIYVSQSLLNVVNSTFQGNIVNHGPWTAQPGDKPASPSAAQQWHFGGGAIAVFDNQTTQTESQFYAGLNVSGTTTFTANEATGNGGAILLQNGVVYIPDTDTYQGSTIGATTTFTSNKAFRYPTAGAADWGGYGGAIMYQRDHRLANDPTPNVAQNVFGATFTNNVADNYGGAIAGKTLNAQPVGTVTDNLILNIGINAAGTIGSNTFTTNQASRGGAIFTSNTDLNIVSNIFTGNIATPTNPVNPLNGNPVANVPPAMGGAISAEGGTLTVNTLANGATTFVSNHADLSGGAIHTLFAPTTINNAMFGGTASRALGNTAEQGGAVVLWKYDPTVATANAGWHTITNSRFYNNTAFDVDPADPAEVSNSLEYTTVARGGALLAYQSQVSLNGTTAAHIVFQGNQANKNTDDVNGTAFLNGGGAIAVANNSAAGEIGWHAGLRADYVDFVSNSARGNGGAILTTGAWLNGFELKHATFTTNHAYEYDNTTQRNDLGGSGGAMAIYILDTTGTYADHLVRESTFTGNTAANYGGAISAVGMDASHQAKLTVGELRTATTLSPTQTLFGGATAALGNTAQYGGAIFGLNADIDVTHATFNNNVATTGNLIPEGKGGAIMVIDSTLNLHSDKNPTVPNTSLYFINNRAELAGGAVAVLGNSNVTVVDASFGTTTANGGDGNTAIQGGAIYYANILPNTVTLSHFTANKAIQTATSGDAAYGGAIASETGLDLTIEGSDFTDNTVTTNNAVEVGGGGAIAFYEGGTLNVGDYSPVAGTTYQSRFVNNSAQGLGGAIHARMGVGTAPTVNVTGAAFTGNAASLAPLQTANTPNGSGGAIAVEDGTALNVTKTMFTGNGISTTGAVVTQKGGAIAVFNTPTNLNATGTDATTGVVFDGNAALVSGGAVYADKSNVVSKFNTYQNNTSGNSVTGTGVGGAVAFDGNGTNTYTSTHTEDTFTGNAAYVSGGAIYAKEYQLTVNGNDTAANPTFYNNVVFTGNGGAIAVDNTTHRGAANALTVGGAGTTFDWNSAFNGEGGAIFTKNADATVANADFTRNSAWLNGGAVSIADGLTGSTATFTDSNFTNNQSDNGQGGAISAVSAGTKGSLVIESTTGTVLFDGNSDVNGANDIYAKNFDTTFKGAGNIVINDGFESDSTVTKIDLGTTTINADSHAATLGIQQGTFGIGNGSTVNIDGVTTLAAGATLGVVLDVSSESNYAPGAIPGAALTTGQFNVDSMATIDISGYTNKLNNPAPIYPPTAYSTSNGNPGGVIYTLVDSVANINNKDNYTLTVGGNAVSFAGIQKTEFMWIEEIRNNDNLDKVQVGAGLIWNNTAPTSSHGYFDIITGKTFDLDANLVDNTTAASYKFGWDGKTLTKTGAGTLLLSGKNSYTGQTLVTDGTLIAGHVGTVNGEKVIDSVSTGQVVVDGSGVFQVGNGTTIEGKLANEVIDGIGKGKLAINAGTDGVITIDRVNSYSGDTDVLSGTLKLTNARGTGDNVDTQNVKLGRNTTLELAFGGTMNSCETDKSLLNDSNSYSQTITGAGGVTKSGTGTLVLTAANSYTGDTKVTGGSLIIDNIDALGKTKNIDVALGSAFTIGSTGIFNKVISGEGNVYVNPLRNDIDGTGAVTLAATNTYTGETIVCKDSTAILTNIAGTGANEAGRIVTLREGATLDFNLPGSDTYSKTINGDTKNVDGKVEKHGAGRITLTAANAYGEGTDIYEGRIIAKNIDAVGSGTVNLMALGTELEIAATGDFDNVIDGAGDVIANPGSGNTLVLSQTNDYTGTTLVSSGTLKLTNIDGTGRNTTTDNGDLVTLNSGTKLDIAVGGTYYKDIAGYGTLVKSALDLVTLSGVNTHQTTLLQKGRTDITNSSALGLGTTTMSDGTTLGFDGTELTPMTSFNLGGSVTMDTMGNNATIDKTIEGVASSRLTKIGEGTLTLLKENNFNGLNVNEGQVTAMSQKALGLGQVVNKDRLEVYFSSDKPERLRDDINSVKGTFIKNGSGRMDVYAPFMTDKFVMAAGDLGVTLGSGRIDAANGFTVADGTKIIGLIDSATGLNRGQENAISFEVLTGVGADGAFQEMYREKGWDLAQVEFATHVGASEKRAGTDALFYDLWIKSFEEAYGDMLSDNATNAAAAADQLPLNDPLFEAISALTSTQDVVRAFSELHGEIYETAIFAQADMQRGFNDLILRRRIYCEHAREFKALRAQSPRRLSLVETMRQSRELWVQFTGGGNFRSAIGKYSAYDMGRFGVATGFEQLITGNFFGGLAFGYDQGMLKLSSLPSSDRLEAFRLSIYGEYHKNDWSTTAYFGYAKNWHNVEREINFLHETARSKFNDDVLTAGIEVNKTLHWNSVRFIPTIAMSYVNVQSPYVEETGAYPANLYVHGNNYNSLRVPMGVRINSDHVLQRMRFTPEFRLFYIPELAEDRINSVTAFATDPTNAFVVDAGVNGRNGLRVGVGVTAEVTQRISLGIDYDAEIWNGYSRHDVGGNVTVRW